MNRLYALCHQRYRLATKWTRTLVFLWGIWVIFAICKFSTVQCPTFLQDWRSSLRLPILGWPTPRMSDALIARFIVEQVHHCANMMSLAAACGLPVFSIYNPNGAIEAVSAAHFHTPSLFNIDWNARPLERILDGNLELLDVTLELLDITASSVDDMAHGGRLHRRLSESLQALGSTDSGTNGGVQSSSIPETLSGELLKTMQIRLVVVKDFLQHSHNISISIKEAALEIGVRLRLIESLTVDLPWYDTWLIYQLFAPSKSQQLHEYAKTLTASSGVIQEMDHALDIARDNLKALTYYVEWYDQFMPHMFTKRLPYRLGSLQREMEVAREALHQVSGDASKLRATAHSIDLEEKQVLHPRRIWPSGPSLESS